MSITYEVLGAPGRDNALLATINTGQSQHRLLFDCGEGCLDGVQRADIQMIEVLFFSHFHIDHVAGFDSFFRSNWYRAAVPVRIFGPDGTRRIIHHRIQGVSWNLVEDAPGEVHVTELDGESLATSRYLPSEGFAREHRLDEQPFDGVVYRGRDFRVEARAMHHGIPSMAYFVRESDRSNIDMKALAAEGYTPGPWLREVKDASIPAEMMVEAPGIYQMLGDLRDRLLVYEPGGSIAYLTDFCLRSEQDENELVEFLHGCKTLVCENNFRDGDVELAKKSHHMTSADVGRLAARVQPEELVVFHLSDRYTEDDWKDQLEEVRQQFERAEFPAHWRFGRKSRS